MNVTAAGIPHNAARTSPGRILAILYVGYLLGFLDRVIFGLALPEIKTELALGDTQLGLLSGVAFAISYALFAPMAGLLADRGSRKKVLMGAVLLWSLATAATALATDFWTMFAARALVGAGEAALMPLAVSLISATRTGHDRDRAMGAFLSAGAVGHTVALVFGGAMIRSIAASGGIEVPWGLIQGWQSVFFAAGLAGLIFVAVIASIMGEPPRAAPAAKADAADTGSAWGFIRSHPMLVFSLYIGLSTIQMATVTTQSWIIAALERNLGWTAGDAGLRMGLTAGVSVIIGAMTFGSIIKQVRQRGFANAPFLTAIGSGAIYGIFMIAALFSGNAVMAMVFLTVAYFFGYGPTVSAYAMMGETLPSRVKAQLTGFNTFCNALICNSLGTYIVGALSEDVFTGERGLSLSLALLIGGAVAVGSTIVLLGLPAYLRRVKGLQA